MIIIIIITMHLIYITPFRVLKDTSQSKRRATNEPGGE